jgi:hypothetical protein
LASAVTLKQSSQKNSIGNGKLISKVFADTPQAEADTLPRSDIIARSVTILRENDFGGYTIPAKGLYPYQWNWDSALVSFPMHSVFCYAFSKNLNSGTAIVASRLPHQRRFKQLQYCQIAATFITQMFTPS